MLNWYNDLQVESIEQRLREPDPCRAPLRANFLRLHAPQTLRFIPYCIKSQLTPTPPTRRTLNPCPSSPLTFLVSTAKLNWNHRLVSFSFSKSSSSSPLHLNPPCLSQEWPKSKSPEKKMRRLLSFTCFLLLSPTAHVCFPSPSPWMKVSEGGEKESVLIGPLKDSAGAARPPLHCERASHLYHTKKIKNKNR